MAVKIRLKRMGKVHMPFYRIVVADSRTKRDGRVIEEIGIYNPKTDPSVIQVDSERAQHWLSVGAQPSEPVRALLSKTGDWQKFRGEPAPPPLLEQKPRPDRTEQFNEVLRQAHGDTASEAVTTKKAAKKPAKKAATAPPAAADEPAAGTSAEPVAETADEPANKAAAEPAAAAEPPAETVEPVTAETPSKPSSDAAPDATAGEPVKGS